jgi:site-specific recombinase XerD
MNANITTLFYIKRAKPNSKGLVPIFMRVTVDGQRIEKSTGKYINPETWSAESTKMKGKSETARSINSYLEALLISVSEAEKDIRLDREVVNYANMKKKITGKANDGRMLVAVFQAHNDKMQALVPSKEFAQGTVERYKTTLNHIKEFLLTKKNLKDIDIEDLDFALLKDFEFFLITSHNCKNNTAVKYIKNFRKVINECLDNDWLKTDPFKKYKCKITRVDRDYLTEDELQKIYTKDLVIERLALVRDIFIFSCFTGLAYIDVKNLTKNNISIGIDGSKWIFTKRQKTEGPSNIPILPMVQQLIEKYEDHPQCINRNVLMPILSNQRMNSYLKEIADVCGINKDLTFHVARHTFATTVTLSNGVPLESVSKMLGHTSWKSTQIYARVLDKKIGEDMQILRDKFNLNVGQATKEGT